MLLPRAWFYCGGAIGCRWLSRSVWWVGWPILVCFFCFQCVGNYFFCVRARDVGMITKIIYSYPMQRVSECRVWFGHCGMSLVYPEIYKSVSAKKIAMYGSILRASNHFCNASTRTVHLPKLPLWIHWCRYCIVSRANPQSRQRLVVACPRQCRIFMVGRVLLMNFLMKCTMWTVVVPCDFLNCVG